MIEHLLIVGALGRQIDPSWWKEGWIFCKMMHSTCFVYGYVASDIW